MNNKKFIFLIIFIVKTTTGMDIDIVKVPCWHLQGTFDYNSPIQALQFSPVDNHCLAIASDREIISLIDIVQHKKIKSLPHDTLVESLCFNSSGKLLATTSGDHYARIFDITANTKPSTFFHDTPITSACFSPNGQYLATRSKYSGNISIFDIDTHKEQIYESNILNTALSFDTTGNNIIIGTYSDLLIANIKESKKLYTLHHNSPITSIYCDPYDNVIITGSSDHCVHIFTLNTDDIYTLNVTLSHDYPVLSVDYNHSKKVLATRTSDGKAHLFDINTQQKIICFSHEEFISSIAFNNSGDFLAIGSDSGKIRIFTQDNT